MTSIAAMRLRQFGITFYQTILSARDVERLVSFEVLSYGGEPRAARKGAHPKGRGRASLVNWEILEERIQRSGEAFQRPIIHKKIEELVEFFRERREHRDLPAVPGAVLLVSERRLEWRGERGSEHLGTLQLPAEAGVLRTLDGQHRLLALHALAQHGDAEILGIEVPAVIFDALQPAQAVEMFVTINTKHTRLKPDLIVSLAGKKLYPDEKTALAHDIIRLLNEREESPLRGQVRVLGVGSGKVSQAPLAAEMVRVFGDLEAAGLRAAQAFYDDAKRFFLNYFKVVARCFPKAWAGRSYAIKSGSALRAFIRVAPAVVGRLRQHRTGADDARALGEILAPWRERIGDARFETKGAWREKSTGLRTVEVLAQELRDALAL